MVPPGWTPMTDIRIIIIDNTTLIIAIANISHCITQLEDLKEGEELS